MTHTCKLCDKPTGKHLSRCDEHHRCDDCESREDLCQYCEGLLCDPCHAIRVEKRIATFSGETDCTPEIVCPWCGYEQGDSWECSEGEQQCGDCGRTFDVSRDVAVTYCTTKIAASERIREMETRETQ